MENKRVLEKDYEENKEPSNQFINAFAKHMVCVCRMIYFLMRHPCLSCFNIISISTTYIVKRCI